LLGVVVPQDKALRVCAVTRELGQATYLDGARLWNASAASGVTLDTLSAPFDLVAVAHAVSSTWDMAKDVCLSSISTCFSFHSNFPQRTLDGILGFNRSKCPMIAQCSEIMEKRGNFQRNLKPIFHPY
jgi:hypothetical protein